MLQVHRPRLATADDFRAFFGRDPPEIWFGLAAQSEGVLLGLGIVRWDEYGRAWGSYDTAVALPPGVVHKAALSVLKTLLAVGEPIIYSFCDWRVPRAEAWLSRLGFAPDPLLSTKVLPVWFRKLADG